MLVSLKPISPRVNTISSTNERTSSGSSSDCSTLIKGAESTGKIVCSGCASCFSMILWSLKLLPPS